MIRGLKAKLFNYLACKVPSPVQGVDNFGKPVVRRAIFHSFPSQREAEAYFRSVFPSVDVLYWPLPPP